jgi:hypothetical protein
MKDSLSQSSEQKASFLSTLAFLFGRPKAQEATRSGEYRKESAATTKVIRRGRWHVEASVLFFAILSTIFVSLVVAKGYGVDVPWLFVFAPMWIPVVSVLFMGSALAMGAAFSWLFWSFLDSKGL